MTAHDHPHGHGFGSGLGPGVSDVDSIAVRLRLIGQMEAWTVNSESVLPPGRKTRALLAIVVLSAPRPVLRSRLAELLWSRRPEEQARASLRQEIHRLLEVLAPAGTEILIINRDSLVLRPGVVWVDVDEVLRATTASPGALALLDSELLEELDGVDPAFDIWLHGERERLRDRARSVAEALLNEQIAPETLIPVAQQLLAIDRAHEGAWRALMRAHAERGERGMAIQSYDRCRAVLSDMLDAAPSPETQALLAEIRSGKAVRAPVPTPPPVSPISEPKPEARPPMARTGARIGVLPLSLVGTDPAHNHLAMGLAEEITSALSRFRLLSIVSTSSLVQTVADGRDDTVLRNALGLDYLIDGTVQRAGDRIRIAPRLIDLRDGNQVVWTRRFDRTLDDLLSLQDEVASETVAQIDPEVLRLESRRAAQVPIGDAGSWDLLLRALPGMSRSDRPQFMESGASLRRAIERQPDLAPAHSWLAYWFSFLDEYGWSEDRAAIAEQAARHAERGITLDPQNARSFTVAGHVRAALEHRLPEAISLHERALALNPNLAMAWALSGFAHLYTGRLDEAELRLARYRQLSPGDPFAFQYDVGFSLLAFLRGDHEKAAEYGRAVNELNPDYAPGCKIYLAALGQLGKDVEATMMRKRLLAFEPNFGIERFIAASPFEDRRVTELLADGLRRAGIKETASVVN
jgi:DNA-binding SARP family transcriptional activator/TolB-like protein